MHFNSLKEIDSLTFESNRAYYVYHQVWQSKIVRTALTVCVPYVSEETAIMSRYNINLLIFVTETENVYCAVRTESLNMTGVNFILQRVNLVR
jgi:hypothetical protein